MFKKIPRIQQLASVYAVIVVMVYYPTVIRLLWIVPSWSLYSTIGELISVYSYAVTVNFLESLLILGGILALSIVMPRKWFYDRFVSRGVSLVVLTLGFLIYLGSLMRPDYPFPLSLIRRMPFVAVGIIAITVLIDQIGFLRRVLDDISDRLIVFLYFSLPVSVVGVVIVIIRNLF